MGVPVLQLREVEAHLQVKNPLFLSLISYLSLAHF
jgi:hypothetical protein